MNREWALPRKSKLTLVATRKPQLRKRAPRDWSKVKAASFLSVLAETCNVSEACRRSGVPMTVAYRNWGVGEIWRAGMNSGDHYEISANGIGSGLAINKTNLEATFGGNANLASGKVYKVDGTQVVGPRQIGTAANATDLASALVLVNDLKAKLVAHGLIA